MPSDRDMLEGEVRTNVMLRDKLAVVRIERDALKAEVDVLTTERDSFRRVAERLEREKNEARAEVERLTKERDEARAKVEELHEFTMRENRKAMDSSLDAVAALLGAADEQDTLRSRAEALATAAEKLIRSIEVWESDVEKVIGRVPRTFIELDAARAALRAFREGTDAE